MKQLECLEKNDFDKLEEDFYSQKIGQPKILMSMTDRVQIQSVTASLSYMSATTQCSSIQPFSVVIL